MNIKSIRIGTRQSPLALWQATQVSEKIQALGYLTEIVPIFSSGDLNLDQPIYSLGITGVFTKNLDIALLNHKIDIAVHSLKDVPTQLPKCLEISAVLERDFPQDVLIRGVGSEDQSISELKIATSSLRRKSFWLNQFPNAKFVDVRGNIQTRLEKLSQGLAGATILSLAGIKRLELNVDYEEIPFMLPAPAQGVIACMNHSENLEVQTILQKINHQKTKILTDIERGFLKRLESGCSAPIAAMAKFSGGDLLFQASVCSLDGKMKMNLEEQTTNINENWGAIWGEKILALMLKRNFPKPFSHQKIKPSK